jgi:hypothetical protein
VIQTARIASPGNNPTGSAIIARLQRLFAKDPKGKKERWKNSKRVGKASCRDSFIQIE